MKFLFWIGSMVCCLGVSAQNSPVNDDSIKTKVILVGDAGALVKGKAMVLDAIRATQKMDERTVVVYLGDNLYDAGLPDETFTSYSLMKAALDSQIALLKDTKAKGYMIPGNHDWENGRARGYEAIVRQQRYVDQNGGGKLEFYPKEGCPGPIEIELSEDVVLIMMDSQWWIHDNDKPGVESDCEYKTEDEVISELEDLLNKNYKKLVLLACHHPFKSNGPHGGYFTFKQHIFPFTDRRENLYIPLPVLGSVYPITRSVFGTPQDLKHPRYINMVSRIMGVVKTHPHVVMLHGHEHTLQLLQDSSYNYIISGAGSKTNRVSPGRNAKFVARSFGFATLDIMKDKHVNVTFFTVDENKPDSVKNAYSENILDFSKLPPVAADSAQQVPASYVYKDYVEAPASTQYEKAGSMKLLFNGKNHRKEWSTPVRLKVFNIHQEKGGFKIEGVGGGKQTKSLSLIDKDGHEWALRTIDKDPAQAIPANFRESFASDVVQDLISAAHPYAPLAIPPMAQATGVLVATPEFFFVPDDPALGYYRPMFANKVCMLERKDPAEDEDSKSSYKLFNKMREDNDHTVDQENVLRARLLDILVADWDRHFDQWRWATTDTGQGKLYRPIPRDRDQAFFYSEGLIIRYVARRRIPFLKGLRYGIPKINSQNKVAKDFDRMFLNNLDENDWKRISADFATRLTDTVISESVHKMPPEIYAIRGETITKKLINRKNMIGYKALRYYRFISKEVEVLGSNDNEFFRVTDGGGDSIKLTVYSYRKHADTNFVMYQRVFDPKITKEIRMYGFNGADRFQIDSGLHSSIRIRMIGGRGNDSFAVKSPLRTIVYDNTNEQNYLERYRRTKQIFEADPNVNEYKMNGFNYPVRRYPRFLAGINGDDGLLMGTGFWFIDYGFRKEPYKSSHKLIALFALTRKAYQLKYNGELIDLFGKTDLLLNGYFTKPVLNNFYGFGNNTKIDETKPVTFYRVRYSEAGADILFRRKPFRILSLAFGPTFYRYWNRYENNKDYVLSKPSLIGLDSADVYTSKTYAGAKLSLDLDNLNSDIFPTRGIRWTNNLTLLQPLDKNSHALNKIESDMVIYASLKIPARVVGVIKLGAGHIFNDSIQYFQALSLGQNNVLRGFRKNRFSGHSVAYGSLELRIKL
ncbi:MAG: BamA/TamA family outer membrane protein, partial [Chitinophagaceae bacterium]